MILCLIMCLCLSSSVWSEGLHCAKHHAAPLQDCGGFSCSSRQLALAGEPAAGWWADVWRGSSGQLLGGHCGTLLCWVSVSQTEQLALFENRFLSSLFRSTSYCLCSGRGESYWTAVVGEFDITKADPDEQVLKVNRIIPHPKVNINVHV